MTEGKIVLMNFKKGSFIHKPLARNLALLGFFLMLFSCIAAQPVYPKGYFRNPMGIPMDLSSNFGELRTSHWHMGLDIRTNQRQNLPVYAAAEGYISRVSIQPGGFGRAIYINHPNGLTTLYAHLNNFSPRLESYIKAEQYKKESWAIDISLPQELFPVKKGEFIAYSGNTGGSQGPHLHFEIRDTRTSKCLNPLLFGLPVADAVPPTIYRVAMYDREKSVYHQSPKLFGLKKTAAGYTVARPPVIVTGSSKISFAIQAYDRLSRSNNPNGIFSATIYLDEKPLTRFVIDSIDYMDTRFMNAHIDYRYKNAGGSYLQHLSKMRGDQSRVYEMISGNGVIELRDSQTHDVRIEVVDANRNTSQLRFRVRRNEALMTEAGPQAAHFTLVPGEMNVFEREDFEVIAGEEEVYDTVHASYSRAMNGAAGSISAAHSIGNDNIPIHRNITVRIKPANPISDELKDKIVIRRNGGGRANTKKASWQSGWLSAGFDDFGTFQAFLDQQAPTINSPGRGDTINLSAAKRIVFYPKDNFGLRSFRAELNGSWLRFTNDKFSSHIYIFDDRVPYGVHHLKVTVEDLAGNITTKSWWFRRAPYTPPKKSAKKKSTRKKPTRKKR